MTELKIPGIIHRPRMPWQGPAPTYCFNPGLAEVWGKLIIVYRVNRQPSGLWASELDDRYQPTRTIFLPELSQGNIIAEDPRLVRLDNGNLGVWYVGIHHDTNPACSMTYAELGPDYRMVCQRRLRFEQLNPYEAFRKYLTGIVQEKNWIPFRQDDRWLAVYRHEPFTVIEKTHAGIRQVHVGNSVRWGYGAIRGGAPPVRMGDYWYAWFHSSRDEPAADGGAAVKVYYVGCYAFDDAFCVQAITPEPIMAGSAHAYTYPWIGCGRISACFPCGAIVRGDRFLISYGWLDSENRLAEVSVADVEDRMVRFPPSAVGPAALPCLSPSLDPCPLIPVP
jgi:predicted GH43/DUF377 family glycosyl hydrolase